MPHKVALRYPPPCNTTPPIGTYELELLGDLRSCFHLCFCTAGFSGSSVFLLSECTRKYPSDLSLTTSKSNILYCTVLYEKSYECDMEGTAPDAVGVRSGRRQCDLFGRAAAVEQQAAAESDPLDRRDQVERRRQRALLLHVPHPQRAPRVLPLVVRRVLRALVTQSAAHTRISTYALYPLFINELRTLVFTLVFPECRT